MNANSTEAKRLWRDPVVRVGIITVIIPMFMCFLPNVYLYVVHGAIPTFEQAMNAWWMVALMFGAFYVVEPISYYPILGLTGTYISFLSGNIGNVRIPCAAAAQDVAGTEPGTLEGEIVATLGLAGSVVTNLFFVSLAALAGKTLLDCMPEVLQNAFKTYTVPAIFGAVFGQFGMKAPILIIFGLGIPLALLYFAVPVWIVIVVAVFGTVAISRLFYKIKLLK